MSTYNFGCRGVPQWNFGTWRAAIEAWQIGYSVCGHRSLKIWEGKNVKNLTLFRKTFDFECNISGMDEDIDKP